MISENLRILFQIKRFRKPSYMKTGIDASSVKRTDQSAENELLILKSFGSEEADELEALIEKKKAG